MKMRNLLKAWILLLFLPVLLHSCKEDNDQELRDQEMRLLQQYIEDNNITQEPTASGLYYIEIEEGTGTIPGQQHVVDFNYTTELINGTIIWTSDKELAEENSVYSEDILYGPIRLLMEELGVPGVYEGLLKMKEGGKATMIVPSDINGYGSATIGASGPYSTHIYTIELINAFDDPEAFQEIQIANYLDTLDYDSLSLTITDSDLYYIEDEPGEGELIKDPDNIEVWYTGSFLDGRVFDSNIGGTALPITMPADGYIDAWDEALRLMRPGTQARIIVPYQLGYGENGYGKIPRYKTLVFDLEIIKD